jgi:outer membrane lipoprotein-sorting protein
MKKFFSLFVIPLLIFSPLANANKGSDIANTVNEAAKGYGGESSSIELSIRNSSGKVKKRSFDMKLKEGSNGGYSLLTTFTAPMDLAKTKLLTIVGAQGYDQWLRMGHLSKGKKVEANSSAKSFVDSDLSYEDVAGLTAANFKHKYVKDSQGGKVWILDQTPKGKSSYSRRSVYISKKYKYPIAIYFYSKARKKIKTAEFKNFKSHKANGKTFWFPNTLSVKNHKSGSETTLQYTKRSLGVKFADSDFSSKL